MAIELVCVGGAGGKVASDTPSYFRSSAGGKADGWKRIGAKLLRKATKNWPGNRG